jgi:hypothetical protein
MIDVIKPALVLDVDGAFDPSELNAPSLGQRNVDRPTVVRANPGVTEPAIGWDVSRAPKLMTGAEMTTIAIPDDRQRFYS